MQPQVSSVGIAALLEQASRLIHSSGYAEGLYPAQWIALRYFSEASPAARTTAALARFQGMSLGPVARTVRTLVDKGLLGRQANPASRRADLITVTLSGQTMLRRDPRAILTQSLESMPVAQREALADGLEGLLYLLFAQHAAGHIHIHNDATDGADGSEGADGVEEENSGVGSHAEGSGEDSGPPSVGGVHS